MMPLIQIPSEVYNMNLFLQNDHAASNSSGNSRSDQSGSPTPDDLSPQAGTSDLQVETRM